MARLIDAVELQANMMEMVASGMYGSEDMIDAVIEAPTLSTDEVRGVGEWIETAMPSGWYDVTCAECSVCGEDFMLGDYCMDDVRDLFHYCPNCGAKMKGAEDG